MTQDYRRFLRPEELSRIDRLEIRARHIVEGFLSGMHRSPYFGQSVEFVQHREYAQGDDIRRIDWKVWSKTDKYYIKQYEEETNLRTTLVVDVSESMQFGSGAMSKYEYGCTVAAALTHLLLRQQDAVGMVAFDDAVRSTVPCRSKKNHIHSILQGLAAEAPREKTDINVILQHVAEQQSRRGMIVLISDLFAPREGLFKGLKMLRHRGHDVMIMHIMDDEELDFNYAGTTRFIGMEEMGDLVCNPKALRQGYIDAVTAFQDEIRLHCARTVVDYQTIRTSEHLDAALSQYLNHRIGMRQSVRN